MEYHWNHFFSQPKPESSDHLSSCVAEVDGGHQPPLESELPALDERASVPAAPAPGHCGGLPGGEGRKCEEVVAGRDRRVTLLRGKIPRIWKMWEDSLEDAFVVIDTVLFVNQMKFGRISSAHCYGSILGRVVVGLLSFLCETFWLKGGLWWACSLFVWIFDMGDWATFDWRQLDTHTLVCILSGVWQELSSRLLARYPFSDTAGAHSVPSPSGSFTVIGDSRESSENVPLRIPFSVRLQVSVVWRTVHQEGGT